MSFYQLDIQMNTIRIMSSDYCATSDKVKFWLRMEKKIMEKKLQEKKEEEKNRDTVATLT